MHPKAVAPSALPTLLLAWGLILTPAAGADGEAETQVPSEALEFSDGLTGKVIYQAVIDNHLRTFYAEQRFISVDPGGDTQELRVWSRFKDFRVDGRPTNGVISRTIMKFTYPQDQRDNGYLFSERHRQENDGYSYLKRRTRVSRVTARERIFGTDFTLEDLVLVRVIDDASYVRLADDKIQDVPVYVVEVDYDPKAYPQYSKSVVYVDKEFPVPLLIKNWNKRGLEENRVDVPRYRVELHAGVWIPMEAKLTDIGEKTHSTVYIDAIDPNIELDDRYFDPKRLARKGR